MDEREADLYSYNESLELMAMDKDDAIEAVHAQWLADISTVLGLRDHELRHALCELQIRKSEESGIAARARESGRTVVEWLADPLFSPLSKSK